VRLPESLLESELFGHRRGAFTGATHDQPGLFEAASGGTILLDEIGDLPLAVQAKLLRVFQEGEVRAVGDRRTRKVDVRVISATNRDLTDAVARRAFRDDLYFRVGAFPIRLPPLRERREDIPLLAERFLVAAAERHRKRIPGIDPPVQELLVRFDWPGNVRELENEIERAAALALDGEAIGLAHVSPKLRALGDRSTAPRAAVEEPAAVRPAATSSDLRDARSAFEVQLIAKVLRERNGNVTRAAEALGISRVALQKKMKGYGLR
jgi:two-component system response regulator HupR/HoxA